MINQEEAKEMLEFLNIKIFEKYKSKAKLAKILDMNYSYFISCTTGSRCFPQDKRKLLCRLLELNADEKAQLNKFFKEYEKQKSLPGQKSEAQKYENTYPFGVDDLWFLVKIAPDYIRFLYKVRKWVKLEYGCAFNLSKKTKTKTSVINKLINGLVLKKCHVQIFKDLCNPTDEEIHAIENFYYKQKYYMEVVLECRKIRKEHDKSSQNFIDKQINEYLHSVGF